MSDRVDEAVVAPKGANFLSRLLGAGDRANEPLRFVSQYMQEADNLWEENRLLRLAALCAFGAAAILSITIGFQAQRTRVIVAPFAAGSPDLLIVGNQPSNEYLSAIARNIVSLTGTFTASTAEYQFNEVLKFVHPSVYDSMRDDWKDMVKGLRQYREVSFATYVLPQKPIEIYGDHIRVAAQRSRFIGDKVGEETGFVDIGYVVENGRFWITSVEFRAPGGKANG